MKSDYNKRLPFSELTRMTLTAGTRLGSYEIIGVVDSAQGESGAPATPQINVVLNWTEELKQRIPVP